MLSTLEKLMSHASPEPNTGCWIWDGKMNNYGYGVLRIGHRKENKYGLAHRLLYTETVGPIPEGMFLCHRCDHPWCVNPAHMFVGTPNDNMQDKTRKGRTPRGETSPTSVLTEAQVREIRELYATGTVLQKDLAVRFNVSQTQISRITLGKRWKHAN